MREFADFGLNIYSECGKHGERLVLIKEGVDRAPPSEFLMPNGMAFRIKKGNTCDECWLRQDAACRGDTSANPSKEFFYACLRSEQKTVFVRDRENDTRPMYVLGSTGIFG